VAPSRTPGESGTCASIAGSGSLPIGRFDGLPRVAPQLADARRADRGRRVHRRRRAVLRAIGAITKRRAFASLAALTRSGGRAMPKTYSGDLRERVVGAVGYFFAKVSRKI
jgi:hypothetical protein